MLFGLLVWGAPLGGGSPSGRPPRSWGPWPRREHPPGPSAVCGPVGGLAGGRRPLCGPPSACGGRRRGCGGLAGVAPLGCRARGPPGAPSVRPLAVVVGGPCCPPAAPSPVWRSPGASRGGGSPPRGPGLVVAGGLVPARPPRPASGGGSRPRRRSVRHCGPLLLSPEGGRRRRRRSRRSSLRIVRRSAMA